MTFLLIFACTAPFTGGTSSVGSPMLLLYCPRCQTGSAERLYREASARGAGRAAAQALLLCRDVLHTPLPSHLILELGRTPRVRWLQRTALNAMTSGRDERRPLDVRFGTLRGSLSALLLGQSWRYRFTELRNLLTNQADMLLLPLPKRFRFLYPVLATAALDLAAHSRRAIADT